MGFTQGLSGLNAAATDLDNIGNNIANAQTTGYKSSTTKFADIYANARVGLGVGVAGTQQNFSDGALTTTGRSLDMAIDGDGFFRVANNGQTQYSRDGSFELTKNGNLANSSGALLTGYNVSNFNSSGQAPTINAGGDPQTIQLPSAGLSARATTQGALRVSLDAGANSKSGTNFNPNNSSSYNYSTPSTVYDSLGNAHALNLYFSKQGADSNAWQMNATISTKSGPVTLQSYNVQFDQNGNLTQVNARDPNADNATTGGSKAGFAVTANQLGNGANPMQFTFDLSGSSQTAQNFAAGNPSQDGYSSGALNGLAIQDNGMVTGSYDNGQTVNLAQIALADFSNKNGLKPVSGNAWQETATSGQPTLGIAGTGQFGDLRGGTLESSNVDLSKELVSMIVSQRNYQANAQSIKTQDQVLQTAVNLR